MRRKYSRPIVQNSILRMSELPSSFTCRDTTHYLVKGSHCTSHNAYCVSCDDNLAFTCCSCSENLDIDGVTRLWPERCSKCNIQFSRWKRMKVWREGIERCAYSTSSFRVRFVTFTIRHGYYPVEYRSDGSTKPPPTSAAEETRRILDNFRRMKRSVHFKRAFAGGGVWVAECTQKILSSCDASHTNLLPTVHDTNAVARASTHRLRESSPTGIICESDGKDSVRRVIRQVNEWSIHPHIHCLLIGDFIEMKSINKLAKQYGFDNVDVKLVHGSVRSKLNYLSVYLGKEQPLPRSRDAFGECKVHIAQVRKVQEEKRRT